MLQRSVTGLLTLLLAMALATAGAQEEKSEKAEAQPPETIDQKMSYIIGQDMAQNLSSIEDLTIDTELLIRGITDKLNNAEPLMAPEEMEETKNAFIAEMRAKMEEQQAKAPAENMAKAEAFLAENKGKDGVMVTESGLQYKVLETEEGKQPSPTKDDKVRVHYAGTFLDGQKFDSSYDRGEPTVFGVSQVIPGWTEGLQLMEEGDKYQFWIPPEIAYGENSPPSIPPNSLLVFEVELLKVNPE